MSAITLLPYERRCFRDRSRFKALFWARGCHKTFNCTLEIVDECFIAESQNQKTTWLIISRGERQALEAIREAKRHARVYGIATGEIETSQTWSETAKRFFNVHEISFPHGSRIIALPANPDTIVGYTANVYLDEFAKHGDSYLLWRSVYPVLRGRLRMIVSSTPMGVGNKFHQIVTEEKNVWSIHQVDIYQAVADGLQFDIELERKAMADPDGWAQEFELKWLDVAYAWLSYDLISECESDEYEYRDRCWVRTDAVIGACYVGWDIARHQDLSVIWVSERRGDRLVTREVVAMRRVTFEEQRKQFDRIMGKYKVVRAALDKSAMGEELTEGYQQKYGVYRVESVTFSNGSKLGLAIGVKQRFENLTVELPANSDIRESHHAIKKIITQHGNTRFDADRTSTGHGDYFWAHALAIHAAANYSGTIEATPVGEPRSTAQYDSFLRGNHANGKGRTAGTRLNYGRLR